MLYLFNDSLNVNNQKYLYESVASIITHYSAIASTKQFTDDNYRINNNELKIAIDETFTIADAISKNTVIHTLGTNAEYKRVYNVLRYRIQSGFIYYDLQVDLWHTYIYDADIRNLRIVRSTRDIVIDTKHMGFYKTPMQALNTPKIIPLDFDGGVATTTEVDASEFSLVMAVKYNLFQSETGSMSTTKLFAVNIGYLLAQYCTAVEQASNPLAKNRCIQDVISDFLSGLYEVEGTTIHPDQTTTTYTVKCQLKNAWIIDEGTVRIFGQEAGMLTNFKLCVRSKHVGWEDIKIMPDWVSCTDGREIQGSGYTIPPRVRTLTFDDTKPNCKYYIGTPHANLEVNGSYGEIKAEIKVTADIDDLKVLLIQGDQELDITSAFSLDFTAVDGDITYDRYILNAIENALPLIASWGSMGSAVLSGNTFSALSAAANVYSNATNLMLHSPQFAQRMGYNVKAGSAGMLFFADYTRWTAELHIMANPYCIIEIEDDITAIDELNYYGLVYNITINTISNLFSYNDASTGTLVSGTVDGYDYLQCSDLTFYGDIPQEAKNYIYNKLIGGIRIKEL